MSRVTTYLTLVFILTGDMIRATEYFGEEDAKRALDQAGINWPAERKEIHLVYQITPPLDESQLFQLTWLKDMGIISNFYVRDEISHDNN